MSATFWKENGNWEVKFICFDASVYEIFEFKWWEAFT